LETVFNDTTLFLPAIAEEVRFEFVWSTIWKIGKRRLRAP
jgi:hypothetical protein